MKKIFWLIRHLPVPKMIRLGLESRATDQIYLRKIAKAKDRSDSERIESLEGEHQFELSILDEENNELYTRHLLRKARRMKLPTPRFTTSDNQETGYWESGTFRGLWYLNEDGISRIREEIRKEIRWRREQQSYWISWLSGLVGVIGALIGLAAILRK